MISLCTFWLKHRPCSFSFLKMFWANHHRPSLVNLQLTTHCQQCQRKYLSFVQSNTIKTGTEDQIKSIQNNYQIRNPTVGNGEIFKMHVFCTSGLLNEMRKISFSLTIWSKTTVAAPRPHIVNWLCKAGQSKRLSLSQQVNQIYWN